VVSLHEELLLSQVSLVKLDVCQLHSFVGFANLNPEIVIQVNEVLITAAFGAKIALFLNF
jgi:hypothetical protein